MLYAFNPQGLAQFLAFHRPSVNVHRPELLDSSQRMEGTHSVKVLENICVFSAQHLPSIIEEIETERSQAKYKVICRSPSNSILQGWNDLSLSPNSRPDGLLNLGFHGLTLITMLVSNELGDAKSLVDSFQAVELFFCSTNRAALSSALLLPPVL